MSSERQRWFRLLAPLLLLGLLLAPRPARAFHTSDQRLTDDTADTLEQHRLRLGLFRFEYTPLPSLTIGTYPLPWLLRVPNLALKWRYYKGSQVSLSGRLGFFGFDTKRLERLDAQKTHATLAVVPFDLAATWRVDKRFSMSLDLIWTSVFIKGTADRDSLNGAFQGGTSNLQSLYTFELRATRVTALLLQARFLSFQRANLSGDLVLHPDEFTTVEVHGARDSDALNYRGAYALGVSALFSWELFNLRLGLGYGNYNVPGLNFMLPSRTIIPDFDFYWIF